MRPHQPTPTPHMKGDNRRQRETRPLQSPRRRPHQPPPTPHMKGDNRRQRETTGDKTTSEPKKPTTPTNTKAARSKVALRTPTVNCLGKKQRSKVALRTPTVNCLGKKLFIWLVLVRLQGRQIENHEHMISRREGNIHQSNQKFNAIQFAMLQTYQVFDHISSICEHTWIRLALDYMCTHTIVESSCQI